jgi:hypothetical protein
MRCTEVIHKMKNRLCSYRHGKEILENLGVLDEVLKVTGNIDPHQLTKADRHRVISKAFEANGWSTEKPMKGFKIDGYKKGVFLEIELSHVVHLYHDLLKLMIPFSQGRLHAGVILVLNDDLAESGLVKNHSSLPTFSRTRIALRRLRQCILFPVLLVAIA